MVSLDILWTDTCTVAVKAKSTSQANHRTTFGDTPLLTNAPCRVSFESVPASSGDPVSGHVRNVKLFLSNGTVIPPGSKITVTRGARTMTFKSSGEAAVYSTHQEINLTEEDEN